MFFFSQIFFSLRFFPEFTKCLLIDFCLAQYIDSLCVLLRAEEYKSRRKELDREEEEEEEEEESSKKEIKIRKVGSSGRGGKERKILG